MPPPTEFSVESTTISGALWWMLRHPWRALVRCWNYESAVLSAFSRSSIVFSANRAAGVDAAVAAMVTEFRFRISTAGFYGALMQAFRRVESPELGVSMAASGDVYGDLDAVQSVCDRDHLLRACTPALVFDRQRCLGTIGALDSARSVTSS